MPGRPIGLNLCHNPLSIFQHAQFAFQARRFIFSDFGMKHLVVCALLLFAGADLFAQQNTPPLQQQDTPPVASQQNTPPLPPPEEGERMLKEVTRMLEDPKLLQAAAQVRKSRAQ